MAGEPVKGSVMANQRLGFAFVALATLSSTSTSFTLHQSEFFLYFDGRSHPTIKPGPGYIKTQKNMT